MTGTRRGTLVELLDVPRHRSPARPGEHTVEVLRHRGVGHDEVDALPGPGAVARAAIAEASGR